MSGFLHNLAARGRGALPLLEPRRPAPYEEPDGPPSQDLEPTPQAVEWLSGEVFDASTLAVPSVGVAPEAGVPDALAPVPPQDRAAVDTPLVSDRRLPTPVTRIAPAATASVVPAVTVRPAVASGVSRRIAETPPATPQTRASAPPGHPGAPRPSGNTAGRAPAVLERTERAQPSKPDDAPVHKSHPGESSARPAPTPGEIVEPAPPAPSEPMQPTHKPLLQAEPSYSRPFAQTPVQTPREATPIPEAPVVEVHIGAIEVLSTPPAPAPMQQHTAPSRSISLDDFLDGAGRG